MFFAHDDYTKMYRKMLTIEQFHNPALAAEFSRQYYDGAIAYQKRLFGMLAEKGNFIEADYEVMAVHFYGPIYTLITASGEHCVLLHFHGVFMFPNERAAELAVGTVKQYKEKANSNIKVVFNVFKEEDETIYERLLG